MNYKTVSCESIISKIYRDFKPTNDGWVFDAIEWIDEALQTIGTRIWMEEKTFDVKVSDYRAALPCNLDSILAVEYKKRRLRRSDAVNFNDNCKASKSLELDSFNTYKLNPGFIRTSFESTDEGEYLKIHALAIPVDSNNFPYIPDDVFAKQAISWYVMMMMIGRGYQHHTFSYKDCDIKWTEYYPKAQNSLNFPDLDGYDRIKSLWTKVIGNTNWSLNFYDNHSDNINPNSSASIPSSLTINRDEDGNIIT